MGGVCTEGKRLCPRCLKTSILANSSCRTMPALLTPLRARQLSWAGVQNFVTECQSGTTSRHQPSPGLGKLGV